MPVQIQKARKPTIKDVARAAKVSPTTVSLVLMDDSGSRVSAETRQRILETAKSLNYRPNFIARSLVTQKSHLIGLVITTLFRPFYAEITQDIIDRAEDIGYGVLAFSVRGGIEEERRAVHNLIDRGVDGLLICSALRQDPVIYEIVEQGIPFVLINRNVEQNPDGPQMDYVGMDNLRGCYLATEHLLKMGHRRIAHIAGPQETSTGYERQKGYEAALRDHGLEVAPELIVVGDFQRSSGHELTLKLAAEDRPPTAIFAANDHMGIGALDALRELNLKVPEQMAVVGYDNIEMSGLAGVDLTTVSQQKSAMGRMGVERLVEKIEGIDLDVVKTVTLSVSLVIRKTCGFEARGGKYDDDPD